MADRNNKQKIRYVDDAGIRLAPTPMNGGGTHTMPAVRQEYVIAPRLEIDDPTDDGSRSVASTADDFQPKKQDISKKWKRRRRTKNLIVGILMLALTAIVIVPYILGAAGIMLDGFFFKYVPDEFGAVKNIVEAFKETAAAGWTGPELKTVWLNCVPSFILLIGILALVINLLKSILGILGAIKPKRYTTGAIVYILCVLAVLVIALVGAPMIGVDKIDFVNDFIKGCKSSELFSLTIIAAGYFLASAICGLFNREKYGYLK